MRRLYVCYNKYIVRPPLNLLEIFNIYPLSYGVTFVDEVLIMSKAYVIKMAKDTLFISKR